MIIVGEDEAASDTFTVKDFSKGEQAKLPRRELAGALKS
jgi:histidyl-tRNA synthetase